MSRRRAHERERNAPSLSITDLRFKLSRIVSRHDQLKIAFNQLHSQIRTGLNEAEDVFASLAIPLMKLVGLKTVEMAEEGRFSTIITENADSNSQDCWRNETGSSGLPSASMSGETDQSQRNAKLEEENYASRATMASKELMQKQKLQIMQLVHILRQMESQVNSSQDNILETLATRKNDIRDFFQQAIKYIYAIHQSSQDDAICLVTLKLLKAAFDHVGTALCAVEDGVEEMIHNLAEKMCTPMVKYVHGLKVEMTTGSCTHLLSIIEEMGGAMRIKQLQLAEASIKVKEAEQTRLKALHRFKELEQRVRKTKERSGFFLEANGGSQGHSRQQKFLGAEADKKKDEKLLWELLRSKRKLQQLDSPLGPQDLLGIVTTNKKNKSTLKPKPSINRSVLTGSQTRAMSPQTPCMNSWIPLGSSPSSTAQQQVLSRKRITP